jgi:hypothetical protein
MSIEHEQLSYGELIDALSRFVQEQRTGTMFIVTESRHSARISLEDGRIISCTYTLHRGLDAIAHIRRIRFGAFTFSDGIFNSVAEMPLPSTPELLRDLGATVDSNIVSLAPSRMRAGEDSPAAMAGASDDLAISGRALWNVVVSELAVYLGPVASIAAAEYEANLCAATSRERVRLILSQLALEIPESAQGQEFKQRVMARVSP